MAERPPFEEDPARTEEDGEGGLRLNIHGYEGPIDALLQLAREQKVDLTQIRILDLAEQYLDFIQEARQRRLELAADYLVMAAWLAYLKSRLLLPEPESEEDEPSGTEMAAALRFQLQRLQAMQEAGQKLVSRPRLGRDILYRGETEAVQVVTRMQYDCSLYELLKAYGGLCGQQQEQALRVDPMDLDSVEQALARLRAQLGDLPDWATLESFLPNHGRDPLQRRASHAALFAASLELCREGEIDLQQAAPFAPIYMKPKPGGGSGHDG